MTSSVDPRPLRRRGAWASEPAVIALCALCALAIGVAAYAFLRSQPAMFLPPGWHRPQAHALPVWLLATLPTFVHALALSLLTAAVLGTRRPAAQRTICAAWCAVEIVFEAMQRPALGLAMLSELPSTVTGTPAFASFASFVRSGTFDPLDVAAAGLGSLLAYAILIHGSATPSDSMEAEHAQVRNTH